MSRQKRGTDEEAGPSQPPPAKRGRGRSGDDEAAAGPQAQPERDRRAEMADIARRRAAHFANYRNEDEADEEEQAANPHVGGNQARTLGPWSTAVELANAREAALSARQEKLQEAAAKAKPAVTWTPKRDVALGPRPQCNVPALFDLAMALVVEYAEDVESLWGLPEVVKTRIAAAICRNRRLSPDVARLFVSHSPQEVVLPDCASLDPAALEELLLEAATDKALERLELGMCGRGFTDGTARALAACGCLPGLQSLRLAGAYRLSDAGLEALLPSLPALTSLALPQCSRLEGSVIEALPRLAPQLRELDLTECAGLSSSTLIAALEGLQHLESLVLDGVVEAGDSLLEQLPQAAPLQRLSLCHCAVTDKGVSALAQRLPSLREVRLDDCNKLTPAALAALAAQCRQLHTLSLKRCIKVTDEAVAELARLGTIRDLSLNGIRQLTGSCLEALAHCCSQQLERLDVSWCRHIPEQQLGRLVDACPNLVRLELWGCTHVTDTFLLGHGNDALQVVGRGEVLKPVPAV